MTYAPRAHEITTSTELETGETIGQAFTRLTRDFGKNIGTVHRGALSVQIGEGVLTGLMALDAGNPLNVGQLIALYWQATVNEIEAQWQAGYDAWRAAGGGIGGQAWLDWEAAQRSVSSRRSALTRKTGVRSS